MRVYNGEQYGRTDWPQCPYIYVYIGQDGEFDLFWAVPPIGEAMLVFFPESFKGLKKIGWGRITCLS